MNNGQIKITAQLDDSTLPNPAPMSICDSPAAILLVIALNWCIGVPRLGEDQEIGPCASVWPQGIVPGPVGL